MTPPPKELDLLWGDNKKNKEGGGQERRSVHIEFKGVCMRYRPGLPLVLKVRDLIV